jgi:hypothetical protein
MRPASTPANAPRRLERPREDGVEVDGGSDLAELAGPVSLGARLFEGGGEIPVEAFGSVERVAE